MKKISKKKRVKRFLLKLGLGEVQAEGLAEEAAQFEGIGERTVKTLFHNYTNLLASITAIVHLERAAKKIDFSNPAHRRFMSQLLKYEKGAFRSSLSTIYKTSLDLTDPQNRKKMLKIAKYCRSAMPQVWVYLDQYLYYYTIEDLMKLAQQEGERLHSAMIESIIEAQQKKAKREQ